MIFARPGLGIGLATGPIVTSGLGLVVVIVVVEPATEHLPSSKKLDRKKSKTAQKASKESPAKVTVSLPGLAIVVSASVVRSQVPGEDSRTRLPERITPRKIERDSTHSVGRRNRMNPERKPRY